MQVFEVLVWTRVYVFVLYDRFNRWIDSITGSRADYKETQEGAYGRKPTRFEIEY